ncbi:SET and MYND domain-containing protein 4-like [Tigriopus californicus]|uniref:SET and MYND domain-containing protein 4-like n=1 Tax=Tigriopus californicus TaxID=6832 RepID=UPI0027DA7B0E|nr:SET and MYND domain-containing protein 4-like [Tigriopus californicus]
MIRRQLSDRGKECFLNGEWSKVLDFYNEAALFSTCKGLGHTMARRAAYLLQTGDIDLALRDIKMAFDLGCLERELMDFLLAHHTTDSDIRAANNDASVERSIEAMYNPDIANESKKYFSHKLRADLELIRTQQKGRPTEADVKNVMISLRTEAEKQQADKKDSVRCPFPKIRPPQIDRTNTRYPSFSEAVDVVVDMDKGRKVVAEKEIDIGEIIMTETPNTLFFCPEMEKLPLLKSHCLHCMSYTIAPIPCNECCVVTFCSLECQEAATYHVFECRMKLYEMLHFMGDEYASVFMAIRTITQKPAKYFWQRRDKILDILAMDYPEMRDESEIWSSDAIEPLLRLMSHQDEIEPEVLMKNAVIAVFFLRALQAVNYFEDVMPRKSKTDKRLKEPEALILYILNHLINTQSHNSTPFMRLVECADASNVCIKQDVGRRYFRWEYLGSSISSSLALINHSCDPNCIQFHVGRYAVLVPIRKISAGQEITIAYDKIHHEDQPLIHRQLHCLRKFYFSCECPACHNDWVSYEEMPDTLYLVPNFETEKHFVVRVGDKRDLVRDIERLKLKAEKEFRDGEVEKSIASMNELSEYLENDISKPHQYHIQANHVAILCVMTKFLKDVAKIVERTNFNKQFPPTYVNGEFVYTEKPTTVEESRYWEHGFVTPKPKKKKIVKKQKTTDSDESVQTIPDHVVKVELVNGASALGLNAGNGQPTEMNVNESLTEDEQTLRNAVEISNNSVINVDHELIANQDDVIEIKDNSVVLVDEKLASEENDQIGFVPLIAIQPQAQSQGHDHQPLGEIRSTNLEELQEMHPYGENSLMISNTMKEDSNIKDTIALRSDPPAKEHKPMNIPTDGLQEDVSNAKQKCNTSSELERLSSNLEVVENTPAIEVPLSQPTDTVQPNKPASDLLRNEHNNVENEPEHPSDQDNSFMVENETQLSLAKSIKTADENETMKQAQLNEINGGTRQEVDDKIGTFIPTFIEQGHQLSQVIIPV